MIAMKPFTNFDWMSFSGAEAFADGSLPLIGEAKTDAGYAIVISDASGVFVEFIDHDGDRLQCVSFRGEFAGRALAVLCSAEATPTWIQVAALAGAVEVEA